MCLQQDNDSPIFVHFGTIVLPPSKAYLALLAHFQSLDDCNVHLEHRSKPNPGFKAAVLHACRCKRYLHDLIVKLPISMSICFIQYLLLSASDSPCRWMDGLVQCSVNWEQYHAWESSDGHRWATFSPYLGIARMSCRPWTTMIGISACLMRSTSLLESECDQTACNCPCNHHGVLNRGQSDCIAALWNSHCWIVYSGLEYIDIATPLIAILTIFWRGTLKHVIYSMYHTLNPWLACPDPPPSAPSR